MKVIYELEPYNIENNDSFELKLIQNAEKMHSALGALDDIRRMLYKGYTYYKDIEKDDIVDEKYSLINVDRLIDDIQYAISESNYYEIGD